MDKPTKNTANDPIWLSLKTFAIGGESADWGQEPDHGRLSFSQRLARENGWSLTWARCCIDEYRRFLFLTARAGHAVTPSDAVDQVWHQHLVYTENYWIDLCGEVLPSPLHHGPTQGGVKERIHFQDQYEQTLSSYQRFFGVPDPDFWPPSQERFAQSIASVRINRRRHWVIPKPSFSMTIPSHSRWAVGGIMFYPLASVFPFNLDGPNFLLVYGLLVALAIVFCCLWYCANNGLFTKDASVQSEPPLSWVGLSLLAGGKPRLLQTALLELIRRKIVRCDGKNFELVSGVTYQATQADGEAAIAIYQAICQTLKQSARPQSLKRLKIAIHSLAVRNEMQLQANGYLREPDQKTLFRGVVMTVALGTLSMGALRCYQGATNQQPIGFLVVEMIVGALLFGLVLQLNGKLTAKGKSALEQSRLVLEPSGLRSLKAQEIEAGEMLPYLAILGPASVNTLTTDPVDTIVHEALFGEELRALKRRESSGDGFGWDISSPFSSGSFFDGGGDAGGDAGGGAGCGGGCGGCGGG